MLISAMNFARHFIAWQQKSLRTYATDVEAKAMLLIIGLAALGVAFYIWLHGVYPSFWTALRHTAFNLVSIATDCGLVSQDYGAWPAFAPMTILMLSCYCANTGSTGGGIKMFRTLVLFRQAARELFLLVHPQAVTPVKIGGQVVANKIVFAVLAFVVLYFGTVVTLTFMLLASGLDFLSSFSAIIACINNAGPGLGMVGPSSNYQGLTDFQTWVCALAMLLGRLEIFSVLILFTPRLLAQVTDGQAQVFRQDRTTGAEGIRDPGAAAAGDRGRDRGDPRSPRDEAVRGPALDVAGARLRAAARAVRRPDAVPGPSSQTNSSGSATSHNRQAARPGTYRRKGDHVDVYVRAFRFSDQQQAAQQLRISFDGESISELTNPQGVDVPVIRLDPLLIGSIFPIHGEDRIVVSPDQVPPMLPAALKAVEDRKFDSHHGVDPLAILRALVTNVRAGQVEQGGSTLTQQLVKSYFLDSRRTLRRKAEEAVMAVILESRFEKADIMNAYINEIYLGQDGRRAVHGFGLASQFYFGKPLAECELHEIALLVTIVRGPSYYDPRRHPKRDARATQSRAEAARRARRGEAGRCRGARCASRSA